MGLADNEKVYQVGAGETEIESRRDFVYSAEGERRGGDQNPEEQPIDNRRCIHFRFRVSQRKRSFVGTGIRKYYRMALPGTNPVTHFFLSSSSKALTSEQTASGR